MSEQNGYVSYEFLAKQEQPPPVCVPIKEWGKDAWIRPMMAGQYLKLAAIRDNTEQQLSAIAQSLCKPDGSPIFDKPFMTTTDHAVNLLAKQNRAAFDELWTAFNRVNGFNSVEETVKNSETTESGDSVTS